MKYPSNIHRSTPDSVSERASAAVDRAAKPPRPLGVSRWRAMEPRRFRALTAPPLHEDRSERGAPTAALLALGVAPAIVTTLQARGAPSADVDAMRYAVETKQRRAGVF